MKIRGSKKKIQATRNVPTQSFLFFFFIFNKYIVKITAVETVKSNKKKPNLSVDLSPSDLQYTIKSYSIFSHLPTTAVI